MTVPSAGPEVIGFRNLGGHIDLTMDLAPRRHEWLPGSSLHALDFGY